MQDVRRARTAPAVLALVSAECGGDQRAVDEVLAALSRSQRAGWRALPDPLPRVPAVEGFAPELDPERGGAPLGRRDIRSLLLVALAAGARLELLAAAAGMSAAELLASGAGSHLAVSGGRVAIADPRIALWARTAAAPDLRREAHTALSVAFAASGDHDRAALHRARAGTADDARPGPLLASSRRLLATGDLDAAATVAAAAAAVADGPRTGEAWLLLGAIALAAGRVRDAEDALGTVSAEGRTARVRATAAALRAVALPDGPPTSDPAPSPAAPLAAILAASRGARAESLRWSTGIRGNEVALRTEAEAWRCLVDPACAAAPERWPSGGAPDSGPGRIRLALAEGLRGETEAGLRLLGLPRPGGGPDPILGGFAAAPLLEAARAVARAQLLVWAGALTGARDELERSAAHLPLALPFGGQAVVLARRVEIAIDGRRGPLSAGLASAALTPQRYDRLVSDALENYLEGRTDAAELAMRLHAEQRATGVVLGVPGLDEVGPVDLAPRVEPPDAALGRRLRAEVRFLAHGGGGEARERIAVACRRIRSPFERARVEAVLGDAAAVRGDRGPADRRLRTAEHFFEEAGATAWAEAVRRRRGATASPTDDGELGTCRAVWSGLLTDRETSVALLAAEGRTNRELAAALHLSTRTVELHMSRVFGKLGLRNRGELIALAHRTNGLA